MLNHFIVIYAIKKLNDSTLSDLLTIHTVKSIAKLLRLLNDSIYYLIDDAPCEFLGIASYCDLKNDMIKILNDSILSNRRFTM